MNRTHRPDSFARLATRLAMNQISSSFKQLIKSLGDSAGCGLSR